MEIETAFHTLVGIIIVAVVIVSVVVIVLGILRGSRTITVQECIPADYVTTSTVANSVSCGLIDTAFGPKRVYCNDDLDTCMDPNANKCCSTSDGDAVVYSNIRCCKSNCSAYTEEKNCTDVSCTWCSLCSGYEVNKWNADRCVAPAKNCGYHCDMTWCSAQCTVNGDCTDPIRPFCDYSCKCVTRLGW